MSELTGKTVLITGGGSGLGTSLAKGFAGQGAKVWIAGRRKDALVSVESSVSGVSSVVADVSNEASVLQMYETVGSVDIVIANAGISESAPFRKTDLDLWSQMLAVNLTGTFLTFREGLKAMRTQEWGRLIAVSSTAGLKGYSYVAAYSAAKHGVIGLVRSLALELAQTGITANALCPGFLDTPMTDRSTDNIVKATGMTAEEAKASLAGFNPQGRLIDPDEVTRTAQWLCDEASGGITGQAISISGGEV